MKENIKKKIWNYIKDMQMFQDIIFEQRVLKHAEKLRREFRQEGDKRKIRALIFEDQLAFLEDQKKQREENKKK